MGVVCGSHDGYVYCWEGATGSLRWRRHFAAAVYSSPCIFSVQLKGERTHCVCATSTAGHMEVLRLRTGEVLATWDFQAPVFSSPVVAGGTIVVGCRDNFVYCVEI